MNFYRNDTELLEGFHSGAMAADSQVFKTFLRPMCLLAEMLTRDPSAAEDIVADAFVHLFHKRREFEGMKNIQAFLYTCVRNASLTFNSTRKRHREAEARLFAGQQNVFEESDTAVQLEVIRAELLGNIYREIELLPKNCRVIVKMIFLQGKRTDQIAAELGISSQTVRSQKSRGIRLLKTQLFRRPQVFSIVLIILGLEYISIEI